MICSTRQVDVDKHNKLLMRCTCYSRKFINESFVLVRACVDVFKNDNFETRSSFYCACGACV